MKPAAWHAAEVAARDAYGRLLARLAWRWRDVAAAEDALAAALEAALTAWPRDGVPDAPQAWLARVAERRLLDAARHARVAAHPDTQWMLSQEREEATMDRRLSLLLVCAHPAIDPQVHAALMLQTVLGLDAARIAPAFLATPEAMKRRLSRAKEKIRQARIPFELPGEEVLPERLSALLEAIYAAFAIDNDMGGESLADEALFLAELVSLHLPGEPEPLGLLALMLHVQARRTARLAHGFTPLSRQDTALWDGRLARQADALLARAAGAGRPGPFQLEAAIQAAHASRALTGQTPWGDILALYAVLNTHWPTLGTRVAACAAALEAGRLAQASAEWASLAALPEAQGYQPLWAVGGFVARAAGDAAAAAERLERAANMARDAAQAAFLRAAR